jgi:hypothetical protein
MVHRRQSLLPFTVCPVTDKFQFPVSPVGIHKGVDTDVARHPGPTVQRTASFGPALQTGHSQEGA